MAYREFRNEATYEAPQFDGLPQTLAALDTAARIKAQRGIQDRQELERLGKIDPSTPYPQTTKSVSDKIKLLVEGYNMLNQNPKLRSQKLPSLQLLKADIESEIGQANSVKEASDAFKAKLAQAQNDNKYFKPNAVNEILLQLDRPELTLDQREDLLNQAANTSQDPLQTFNVSQRAKDYVDAQGAIDTGSDITDKSGLRIQKGVKGKFFENGINRISDAVIEDFLSDEGTARYYDAVLTKKIAEDYDKIVAGQMDDIPNTKEGSALRAMIQMTTTDPSMKQAAINLLKEMPELNPIDKRTPFQIKADLIRPELKRYEDISIKNSSDYSKSNPWNKMSGSGGVNVNMQFAQGNTPEHGPSFVAVTRTGNVPQVKAANPNGVVRNSVTGTTSKIGGAGADVSINDWHYGIVGTDGVPINIPGQTTEEFLEYINTAPPTEVKKWKGAVPIARGAILNKGNIIDAKQRLQKVVTDLEGRKESLNPSDRNELEELSRELNEEDNIDFSKEVIQKYLGDAISNVTYAMDEGTATSYEAQTGINPLSKRAMTPDMKAVKEAVDNRLKGLAEQERIMAEQNKAIKEAGLNPLPKEEVKAPGFGLQKPQGKSKETKVIDSTIDDTDSWTTNNQYKVGNSVYYFDKSANQWKKK